MADDRTPETCSIGTGLERRDRRGRQHLLSGENTSHRRYQLPRSRLHHDRNHSRGLHRDDASRWSLTAGTTLDQGRTIAMARITAGIAASHVPAIGAAMDHNQVDTDYWKPLFDGFNFTRQWITEQNPDVVI